jgi:hypothetical protein
VTITELDSYPQAHNLNKAALFDCHMKGDFISISQVKLAVPGKLGFTLWLNEKSGIPSVPKKKAAVQDSTDDSQGHREKLLRGCYLEKKNMWRVGEGNVKNQEQKNTGTAPSLAEELPGGQVLLLEAMLCTWHCWLSWRPFPVSVLEGPSPCWWVL